MSLLLEKSFTVVEAVYANIAKGVLPPPTRVEVIYRTPVEGDTIQIKPNGSKRTMLLLSTIDNTTQFTCSLNVDTSRMKVGDQLFVCCKYLLDGDTNPVGERAIIILPNNMVLLQCGYTGHLVNGDYNSPQNNSTKQQNEFIFDGEYLICTYDTV